jgi:hypothetical protein
VDNLKEPAKTEVCLNCGAAVTGNFCSMCGQEARPTKMPFDRYRSVFINSVLNLDNRFFSSLLGLFVKPGQATSDYLEGRRMSYMAPVRLYLSLSVVYFLISELTETDQVFFVNLSNQNELPFDLVNLIQYSLFLLVPVFGGLLYLFNRGQRTYYIEHLIIALHIHSVWFVLLTLEPLTLAGMEWATAGWLDIIFKVIRTVAQVSTMVYLAIYIRRMYENSWPKTILKSVGIMFSYMLILALLIIIISFVSLTVLS